MKLALALLALCACVPRYEFSVDLAGKPEALSRVVKLDLQLLREDNSLVDGHCNGFAFEGAVLTAAHCVVNAAWIGVRESTFEDGRLLVSYQFRRYGIARLDLSADLAILLPFRESRSVYLPETPRVSAGDVVYFYDHALALHQSTIERAGFVDTDTATALPVWIISHRPHDGDSGSPVFTRSGEFVGLIVAGDQELTFITRTLWK